jgi:hypothetical protein
MCHIKLPSHILLCPVKLFVVPMIDQCVTSSDPCLWIRGFEFGEILSNFDLKNIISIYTQDFPWQKWPKFANFL